MVSVKYAAGSSSLLYEVYVKCAAASLSLLHVVCVKCAAGSLSLLHEVCTSRRLFYFCLYCFENSENGM